MMDPDKVDAGITPASNPRPKRCPVCGKDGVEAVKPFCSKRCPDVDLHRWLGGVYAVPVTETPADQE